MKFVVIFDKNANDYKVYYKAPNDGIDCFCWWGSSFVKFEQAKEYVTFLEKQFNKE